MRSIYLTPGDDTRLVQIATTLNVTKSALIAAAIRAKLPEWFADHDAIRRDLAIEEPSLQEQVRKVNPTSVAE